VLPHFDYLTQRWRAGCHNRQELYQELQQKFNYGGSYSSIRRAIRQIIRQTGLTVPLGTPPSPVIRPVSPRQAAWLLISPAEKLKPEQETLRQILCETLATVAQAYELAQTFARMIRIRQAHQLDGWLDQAAKSGINELKNLAIHLRQDYDTVKAALRLP